MNRERRPKRLVIAISGPVASGKTTLAERLTRGLNAELLRTRPVLEEQYFTDPQLTSRRRLQLLGERLDTETQGKWVADAAAHRVRFAKRQRPLIIDAVRRESQIDEVRSRLDVRVVHIHLSAPKHILEARYEERRDTRSSDELESYDAVQANPTEAALKKLAPKADLRLNTRLPRQAVYARARVSVAARGLSHSLLGSGGIWARGVAVVVAIAGCLLIAPLLIVDVLGAPAATASLLMVLAVAFAGLVGWSISSHSPVARYRASATSHASQVGKSGASTEPPPLEGP